MPNVIAPASLFGYVYVSEDGGDTWSKLKKEFGEIRALANPQLTCKRQPINYARRGGFETLDPSPVYY